MRLLSLILALAIFFQPVNVQAKRCESLWAYTWRKSKLNTIQYLREIWKTKGARFLVRHMNANDLPDRGFFNPYQMPPKKDILDYWHSVIQYVPHKLSKSIVGKEYDFQFFDGIREWTLDPLVHVGTRRFFGERREPGLLMTLPFDIAVMGLTMGITYQVYAAKKYRDLQQKIEGIDKEGWNKFKTDFRYRFIRLQLEQGKITEAEAREWAVVIAQDYLAFMDLLKASEMKLTDPEVQSVLLVLPQFAEITLGIEQGLSLDPGFIPLEGFEKWLTPDQVNELIEQRVFMFMMFETAYGVIDPKLRGTGDGAALVQKLENSGYVKALIAMRNGGKLSNAQLVYHIQEDIYWQMQFHQWNTLHVQKLKPDANGNYDGKTPLTLMDVRKSNLKAIQLGYEK